MTETIEKPSLGLENSFPEQLYLLHHPPTGKYGCYCHQGIHGLACFTTKAGAYRFAEWIDLTGMISQECSFDEAREVAKARPMPIVALLLLDSMMNPQIHYVR